VFQGPLPERRPNRLRLVNPYDAGAPVETRVRSYLHVNCSVCHVSEGGGNANMELGLATPPSKMRLIGEVPMHARFDIKDARLVAPGSPERSALYYRISRRGTDQMPPLASTEVDREAVKLIADWIRSFQPAAR
jgi:mono/diheme cytochrome c family protein